MPDDVITRFKRIISELPSDKKAALHKRIMELPADKRSEFITKFVESYEAKYKKPQIKSKTPSKQPKAQAVKAGNPSPAKTVKEPKKPDNKETPEPKEDDEERKSRIGTVMSVLLGIVLFCGIIYVLFIAFRPYISTFTKSLGIPVEVTLPNETIPDVSEPSGYPTLPPTPTPKPSPTPTPIPTPSPVPLKSDSPDLTGKKIVIDPGHQKTPDKETEPRFEGSSNEKAKATSGSIGVSTKNNEYELTLETAKIIEDYLTQCGAEVILTRDSNDTNISNIERAKIAKEAKPTCYIRLHADGVDDKDISGVRVFIPKDADYKNLGNNLGKTVAEAIDSDFDSVIATDAYTGLNYTKGIKSFQLVMGFLSNEDDDKKLDKESTRYEIAAAIASFCSSVR